MAERREFPALLRRKRYLEQELYVYDRHLRTDTVDAAQQTRWALDAETNTDELNEIEYVLRYFDRHANGYHLSYTQWWLLLGLVALAVLLLAIAVVV